MLAARANEGAAAGSFPPPRPPPRAAASRSRAGRRVARGGPAPRRGCGGAAGGRRRCCCCCCWGCCSDRRAVRSPPKAGTGRGGRRRGRGRDGLATAPRRNFSGRRRGAMRGAGGARPLAPGLRSAVGLPAPLPPRVAPRRNLVRALRPAQCTPLPTPPLCFCCPWAFAFFVSACEGKTSVTAVFCWVGLFTANGRALTNFGRVAILCCLNFLQVTNSRVTARSGSLLAVLQPRVSRGNGALWGAAPSLAANK